MSGNLNHIGKQRMRSLEIPYISEVNRQSTLKVISQHLDQLPKNAINTISWPAFSYLPNVSFSMAHCDDCLFIKFYVEEEYLKAGYQKANDPVYKDSCVEMFIAFERGGGYYNFEFNCIGTCLLGYGSGRENRTLLSESTIGQIEYFSNLYKGYDSATKKAGWELTVKIPVSVFCKHVIKTLSGKSCLGNFYKCGDDLPVPHYLSWNPIQTPEPDFHRPEYFGKVLFEVSS